MNCFKVKLMEENETCSLENFLCLELFFPVEMKILLRLTMNGDVKVHLFPFHTCIFIVELFQTKLVRS
jgi:hypothetical protein